MREITYIQLSQEAENVIQFDAKGMKCGGNKLTHEHNEYGLTLKYLFAVKGLTFKQVGEILGISAQGVNHLVNRTKVNNFKNTAFVQKLCRQLNIDYQYFKDLCNSVKEIM